MNTLCTALSVADVASTAISFVDDSNHTVVLFLRRLGVVQSPRYPLVQSHLTTAATAKLVLGAVYASMRKHAYRLQRRGRAAAAAAASGKSARVEGEEECAQLCTGVEYGGSPSSSGVVVSNSTCSLLEAFLRTTKVTPDTSVLVPGLLVWPHCTLLTVLQRLELDILGYDVNVHTMEADIAHLERTAAIASATMRDRSPSRGSTLRCTRLAGQSGDIDSDGPCARAVVLLVGVKGRFIRNAEAVHEIAKRHGWGVVEVHVPTVTFLGMDAGEAAASDLPMPVRRPTVRATPTLHITSLDGPGMLGGAVGCVHGNGDVAADMRELLRAHPLPTMAQQWMVLAEQVRLLAVSNRVDYGIAVRYVLAATLAWKVASGAATGLRAALHSEKTPGTSHVSSSSTGSWKAARTQATTSTTLIGLSRRVSGAVDAAMALVIARSPKSTGGSAPEHTAPSAAWLQWACAFLAERRTRVDAECYSLWSFLLQLPVHVEVVSAGPAETPLGCVEAASDTLVLYAREAASVASAITRTAVAFTATPSCPIPFLRATDPASAGQKGVARSPSNLQDVVYFPNCPLSAAASACLVFVPLSPSVSMHGREALLECLSGIPPDHFSDIHATTTTTNHRYSAPPALDLLSLIESRYGAPRGTGAPAATRMVGSAGPGGCNGGGSGIMDAIGTERGSQGLARWARRQHALTHATDVASSRQRAMKTASVLFRNPTPLLFYASLACRMKHLLSSKL